MKEMAPSQFPFIRSWGHSFEEDSGGTTVYRPREYPFPAARGRAGIEFHADGTFTDLRIGPADAHVRLAGRWEYQGSGIIRISFPTAAQPARVIEIVACDDQVLKIRQHPA